MKITGIRFKRAGKVYFFDPGELDMKVGQKAIVETVRGVEMGDVVIASKMVEDAAVIQPLKKIMRIATDEDLTHAEENKGKEPKAIDICHEKIKVHNLPMKLVGAEYTFDNSKIIFYFTAEGRVDFRELVKDLASIFKMRIELRQIGVRDEAKLVGGLGPCGLPMCCTTWLGDFDPVSIKMAKEQNLSLNPAKISGICGRLMCCLKYESGMYDAYKAKNPEGAEAATSMPTDANCGSSTDCIGCAELSEKQDPSPEDEEGILVAESSVVNAQNAGRDQVKAIPRQGIPQEKPARRWERKPDPAQADKPKPDSPAPYNPADDKKANPNERPRKPYGNAQAWQGFQTRDKASSGPQAQGAPAEDFAKKDVAGAQEARKPFPMNRRRGHGYKRPNGDNKPEGNTEGQ